MKKLVVKNRRTITYHHDSVTIYEKDDCIRFILSTLDELENLCGEKHHDYLNEVKACRFNGLPNSIVEKYLILIIFCTIDWNDIVDILNGKNYDFPLYTSYMKYLGRDVSHRSLKNFIERLFLENFFPYNADNWEDEIEDENVDIGTKYRSFDEKEGDEYRSYIEYFENDQSLKKDFLFYN